MINGSEGLKRSEKKEITYEKGSNREKGVTISHARQIWKERGIRELAREVLLLLLEWMLLIPTIGYHVFFDPYFSVGGVRYRYYLGLHKRPYRPIHGERVVEIGYAKKFLGNRNYEHFLEVGNVMSHYLRVGHDVLDKYEISTGVINEDIVDFSPSHKYDVILSISTVEHVGFDEPIMEEGKATRAILRIRELLREGGVALITTPLGYNSEIDEVVLKNSLNFSQEIFMKRVSSLNRWVQTTKEEPILRYDSKYKFANFLALLIIEK